MKINKKNVEAKWFKFGKGNSKVEFLIRPFKFSVMKLDNVAEGMMQQFNYCTTDWKGINDENDKPLECNDENKQYLYDYYTDVREFVFEKQEELRTKLNKSLGN